jgi:SLT domain-containing protein
MKLWEAAGAHFYAGGGILGGIGHALSSAASHVVNFTKSALGFLSDPMGQAKKLFDGVLKGVKAAGSSPWATAPEQLPQMAVTGLLKAVKQVASSALGAVGLGPSGGSGVKRWSGVALQALRMVGQPASYLAITLKRMQQESGGNPTIVNKWDSNWKAGHPSVGLMQVIGPTFRSYAGQMKGVGPFLYGVSVNPLANIYASMRYALAAYGSLLSAYGRPGGYSLGSMGTTRGLHLFGEQGPELAASPAGWRVLNARRTAALAGAAQAVDLHFHNHGVIGSQREVEDWLVESIDNLKRKKRF